MKKIILLTSLLFISNTAQAIPPPDAILSVWQSALQLLGVASVFLLGFYYSLKNYLSVWKKPLLIALALLLLIGSYLLFNKKPTQAVADDTAVTIPQTDPKSIVLIEGESLAIKEIIAREPNDYTRNWKLDTLNEMQKDIVTIRKQKKLPAIDYQTITSFSPQDLQQHLKQSANKLFILDVRGSFERKSFYIPYQSAVHYGDLINSTLPEALKQQLPKDKLIVMICHSGLRGYFAANLLRQQGYENVAFLQGGLAAWHKQKLPINGYEDFSENLAVYPVFSNVVALEANHLLKVEIDLDGFTQDLPDLIHLPFEVASNEEVNKIIEQSKKKPVLIVCKSYAGCFHLLNFGHLIEQAGGKVAGIYDKTGKYVIPPIIE